MAVKHEKVRKEGGIGRCVVLSRVELTNFLHTLALVYNWPGHETCLAS